MIMPVLNIIDKRLLRYLIIVSFEKREIDFSSIHINENDKQKSIQSLMTEGLIMSNEEDGKSKIHLTDKGLNYFLDKAKNEYGPFGISIDQIDNLEFSIDLLIESNPFDKNKSDSIIETITSTFPEKIKDSSLSRLHMYGISNSQYTTQERIEDLHMVKQWIQKIKGDYSILSSKNNEKTVNQFQISQNQTQSTSIEATILTSVSVINSSKELSPEEKIALQQLIEEARQAKDKESKVGKIKQIFRKILDKGSDLLIALLPLFLQLITNIH